jgi:glucose-1-phosphate adenylyltransferase
VGTIDAFWQANIDLTDFVPKLDLYDNTWPIWTYAEIVPPAKFIHDEDGRRGSAVSSLVSGDCIVSGSEVRNSLLFTGVRSHSYSSLEYVVALPQVVVNRKARLKNCVIDRGVIVPEGLVVGEDPDEDGKWFRRSEGGIVLVTQDMLDVRAARLG